MEKSQIIGLIEEFLDENGYVNALKHLELESKIPYSRIRCSYSHLESLILTGQWAHVLKLV